MKKLKFRNNLVPLILAGSKTSTWRLFDDKDLSVSDEIEVYEFGQDFSFGSIKITKVIEKPFAELTAADKAGHEDFTSDSEMYKTYTQYYKTPVGPATVVKIVWFELFK